MIDVLDGFAAYRALNALKNAVLVSVEVVSKVVHSASEVMDLFFGRCVLVGFLMGIKFFEFIPLIYNYGRYVRRQNALIFSKEYE